MEKTKAVRLYDKIMSLAKAQGREDNTVKAVLTDPQKATGVCVRCGDEGKVMRFGVFVYTEGDRPRVIKEDRFTVDYCEWCLAQVMNHNEDAVKVMFT